MIPVEEKITQAEKDFLETMPTSVIVKRLNEEVPKLFEKGMLVTANMCKEDFTWELKRRHMNPDGTKVPYQPAPGENPKSLWSRIKRAWYEFHQEWVNM